MTWECGCGVVNRDSKVKCRACQTPKGVVWTPQGSKPADDPVGLSDAPRRKHAYGYGWFCVIGGGVCFLIGVSVCFLIGVSVQNLPIVLVMALLTSAAALGLPWGWHVIVWSHLILTLLVFIGGTVAIARGDWTLGLFFVALLIVILASFIYFYSHRVMFGAKRGWRWFERNFASILKLDETSTERKVGRSGLLEAAAAWGVIFLLAAISIPGLKTAQTRAWYSHAAGDTKTAVTQAIVYANDNGVYPTSMKVLREEGYAPVRDKDSWGNDYVLSPLLTEGRTPKEGDNVYVEDVARAFLAAAAENDNVNGQHFVIGI